MRMILTTLRAAWIHGWDRPQELPSRFMAAARAIVRAHREGKISPKAEARLHACVHCPIYDPKWQACGNGKRRTSDAQIIGCLCYMPFKVTIPTATCWLHDQGVMDEGWPT